MKEKRWSIDRVVFDNNQHWSEGWWEACIGFAVTALGCVISLAGVYKMRDGERYWINLGDKVEKNHMEAIIDYYRDNYRNTVK